MIGEQAIIQYKADIEPLKRELNQIQRINQLMASKLGTDFAKGATIVKNELSKISTSAKAIDLPLGGTTNQLKQFTTVVRGADGQLYTLRQTVAGTGNNIKTFGETVTKGATVTRTFGENLTTLLKRASLTIPVWFAIRQGISTIFRTIRDGLKNIAEFDKALQKLNRNLEATAKDGIVNLQSLAGQITDFSLKSGKSVEEITNAIQKFATVGFTLEESLAGGLNSTKLAITLFGDVEETAQAFARSLRVMTENLGSTEEKQKAIAEALALTDQLWKTNAFEIDEFSHNLENFASVATISNLSIGDTLRLLATLSTGGLANRAGRLLRTTLLKSLQDIDKITRVLDLDFDPKTQGTNEFILEMVKALKEIKTVDKIPAELSETLGELFSVRGTEVISALVALEKTLKDNIALQPEVDKFNQTFEEQLQKINRLVERHKNLNKEMGKAFVQGITGADGYEKALIKIVNTQGNLIDDVEKLGYTFRNAFITLGVGSLTAFLANYKAVIAFVSKASLVNPITAGALALFTALNLKSEFDRLKAEENRAIKDMEQFTVNVGNTIDKGLKKNLTLDELENLIAKMEVFGATNLGFDQINFDNALKRLIEIRDTEREIAKEKEKQVGITEKQDIAENKRKQIAEVVLQHQLDIMRLRGAEASQVSKTEELLRKQLKIEDEALKQYENKLQKQRELNKEKQLETSLSDRTTKLAEIARTEGIDVARKIGEVLRGEQDFDLFEKIGGKPLEVFKDKFKDIFQEQQDIKLFQEKGFSIPVALEDEEKIRGQIGNIRIGADIEEQRGIDFVNALDRGTKTYNEQIQELQKNTLAIQSLENLLQVFEAGGTVTGQQILSARNISANQAIVTPGQKQGIDFNITVDGKNLDLKFSSKEEARSILLSILSDRQTIERIVNSLQFKEAVDTQIEEF